MADEDGIIGFGGELSTTNLINAYKKGIFPWPIQEEMPMAWFSPAKRGILRFDDLHISRSLKKYQRKNQYKIKINSNFPLVISKCGEVSRKGQND